MSRLLAAIDVGSNAARLFIAGVYEHNGRVLLHKQNFLRVPLRLGMDVYDYGAISEKRGKMFLNTMKAFSNLLEVYQPGAYRACATAAIREASNGKDWLTGIKAETGMNINIIDGLEEARLIRNTTVIRSKDPEEVTMFVDVGGGSTEISLVAGDVLLHQRSFNIGTLRMLSGKEDKWVWKAMHQWLLDISSDYAKIKLIGSGGNINKLVKLFGVPKDKVISYNRLLKANGMLASMTVEERMDAYRLREDRADVIVPASKIFLFIMKAINVRKVTAPKIGVADGLIVELYRGMQQ